VWRVVCEVLGRRCEWSEVQKHMRTSEGGASDVLPAVYARKCSLVRCSLRRCAVLSERTGLLCLLCKLEKREKSLLQVIYHVDH